MGAYTFMSQTSGVTFELDSTVDISDTKTSTVSDFKVEQGNDYADNIVVKGRQVTLSGTITDFWSSKAGSGVRGSTRDFISSLDSAIDNKQLFTVSLPSRPNPIRDCAITSWNLNQNPRRGSLADDANAFAVSLTFKQIRVAKQATVFATRNVAPEVHDEISPKQKGAGQPQQPSVYQEENSNKQLRSSGYLLRRTEVAT